MNSKSERKPLLATTAALIMPGLGQVYNGELTKGLSLFLLFGFMVPIFSWLALQAPKGALSLIVFVGVFLALFIYLYSIQDAYRTAHKVSKSYLLSPYNRPYAYIAIFFFGYFFVLTQLNDHTKV